MANILEMLRDYDPNQAGSSGYAFPSTSDYVKFKGPNHAILVILGTGAPTAGDGHGAAPIGSLYCNYATGEWYKKSAAAGTDTWTIVSTAI